MGFGSKVRRLRDRTIPIGARYAILASAVTDYRPLGYEPSLYLVESYAADQVTEHDLQRAVDALVTSRDLWLAELRGYAERRRREKRAGRRSPRRSDPEPNPPRIWYGAARGGARTAVYLWRQRQPFDPGAVTDPLRRDLIRCADACMANLPGDITDDLARMLSDCDRVLRHDATSPQARELADVVWHLRVATGAVPVADGDAR
jgi:hypothetical protein